ncbi:MAG: ribose ABC transporter permease [Ignavibacteriae bacterium]|nr:ribose ABC transporter permease [Ignavibacteriota bacterium]
MSEQSSPKNIFKKLFDRFGIGIALLAELILFSQLSEFFFTPDNILNVTLQTSITAIIAVGMTFVILTGGIDLSVGALVALTGVITTSALSQSVPFPVALLIGLCVGAIAGMIAGVFITKFNITPFIVTLAMMTVSRGLAFMYTEGRPIWEVPPEFSVLGNSRLLEIPIPTIFMFVVYILAFLILHRTRFGRYVYAVGGNKEAARLAGINTNKVLLQVYMISGVLASLSGILLASRMNSGQPNSGLMYELDVIAAVVVGGTSLTGGRGTIIGTFLGAMLIGVLRNGLNLLNVSSYVQMVLVGIVILLAVLMDRMRK